MDNDFFMLTAQIMAEVNKAIPKVLDKAKDALAERIRIDVYDAYTPKGYQRRSKDNSLGTPLNDMNQLAYVIKNNDNADDRGFQTSSALYYFPTGYHVEQKWHDVDGDDLIRRIEKMFPDYNWKPKDGSLDRRPFWQNFITEMVANGNLEKWLVDELKIDEPTIKTDGNIAEETSDRNY